MKCNKCGACCREITFIFTPDRTTYQFHKARGLIIHKRNTTITLQHRCPHLTEDNICDIQNSKPHLCKVYPEKMKKSFLKFQPKECVFRK